MVCYLWECVSQHVVNCHKAFIFDSCYGKKPYLMVAEAILSLCKAIGEMIAFHEEKTKQTSDSNSRTLFVFSKLAQIYRLPKVVHIMCGFEQTSEISH